MKHTTLHRLAACVAAALCAGQSRAEGPPLSATELARCASQVQTLRSESARIDQLSKQHDQTRARIQQRNAAFQQENQALAPDDLKGGLELRQRVQQHNAETTVFNTEIDKIRGEITALNALRDDYDRNCASRSYRRADLDRLPEPARNAMRAGLSGVLVPYLDPDKPPLPR
jgi:hypothetical protein